MKLQLKRSDVLLNGKALPPTDVFMEYGELAVNYNVDDPALFIKDSDDNIIRLGSPSDWTYTAGFGLTLTDKTFSITTGTPGDTGLEAGDSGVLQLWRPADNQLLQWNGSSWQGYDPFTGSWDDVTDKPIIGEGVLTLQINGVDAGTFGANDVGSKTINLETFSGGYDDLTNKPVIGSGTVVIKQGGETKGSFGVNDTGDTEIDLEKFSGEWDDITDKPQDTIGDGTIYIKQGAAIKGQFTVNQTGNTEVELDPVNTFSWSYNDLTDKPTIGDGQIVITQGGETKGSFTVNQTGNYQIDLEKNAPIVDPETGEEVSIPTLKQVTHAGNVTMKDARFGNRLTVEMVTTNEESGNMWGFSAIGSPPTGFKSNAGYYVAYSLDAGAYSGYIANSTTLGAVSSARGFEVFPGFGVDRENGSCTGFWSMKNKKNENDYNCYFGGDSPSVISNSQITSLTFIDADRIGDGAIDGPRTNPDIKHAPNPTANSVGLGIYRNSNGHIAFAREGQEVLSIGEGRSVGNLLEIINKMQDRMTELERKLERLQ